MRKMIGVLIALLLTSCTVTAKPEPEIGQVLAQHNTVLNAIVNYVQALQEKGFLPKPEELEKAQVKKSK